MWEARSYIIIAAFALDGLIGDPQNPLHPIRIIGNSIWAGASLYKRAGLKNRFAQFAAGAVLSVLVVCASFFVTELALKCFYSLSYRTGILAETIICYFLISAKALKASSTRVYRHLRAGDMEKAKEALSFIVGRDTENLNQQEIIKASVETVAENLSDGVIAPLIYICIGGAPLGAAYKAINTLDSMLGYRNQELEYFGKLPARLDDLANFIPARISAALLIAVCPFVGADIKGAFRIFIRDRYNHKSPNSAQTEAACAGALGIKLGGSSYYGGKLVVKPEIGDSINACRPEHILAANKLMYTASITGAVLLAAAAF